MKIYADVPARRSRQLAADVVFVLWLLGCVWLGYAVGHDVAELADIGQQTTTSATSLAGGLTDAGNSLRGMPVVGGGVAAPFDQMSSASRGLAAAGSRQVTVVHRIAWTLGLSVALIPIFIVGIFYVPRRWRFVKEATAGARLLGSAAALDLFALRALTRQPLHRLAEVSADPARAWHVRDPEVIAALAALELQECGLVMPTRPS